MRAHPTLLLVEPFESKLNWDGWMVFIGQWFFNSKITFDEMEVAPRYKLLTMLTWFTLLTLRGPNSLNFPDGKRVKTLQTKCVNRFRDKKSA